MKWNKLIVNFLIAVALLLSCSGKSADPDPVPDKEEPRKLTTEELSLAGSGNNFGFKIFKAVNEENSGRDVFLSPLSISFALGMVLNGAVGETREVIASTLDLSGMTMEQTNSSYKSLMEFLTGLDPEVIFEIANSNWIREGFPVKEEFLELNRIYFDAEARVLDFSDNSACDTINNWVNEKTHGKIPTIVEPPINPLMMLYLINAIYFKGTWTYEFDPEYTIDMNFYPYTGDLYLHPMMMQKSDLLYFNNNEIQAIELPYGDGYYSMIIILPAQEIDINSYVGSFNKEKWDNIIEGFFEEEVNLTMPKFILECEYSLIKVLKALGMQLAFNCQEADFSNIAEGMELCITEVKHKTYVKVNEEGTEAAAVTSVGVGTTALPPEEIYMTINRPFLFVIRDIQSGSMLFMGKILAPEYSE
jgi:serpin B